MLNTTVYSDTMFVKAKTHAGIGDDKCAQVFTTPFDFMKFYPMKEKVEAGHQLDKCVHEIGVMKHLHTDGAIEEYDFTWGKTVKYHHIHQMITEPYSSNQNRAEIAIRVKDEQYNITRKGKHLRSGYGTFLGRGMLTLSHVQPVYYLK
jgi:hypothetical protein